MKRPTTDNPTVSRESLYARADSTDVVNPERTHFSFHTDRNLCIQYWNQEVSSFTGYPASQVLGKKYFDIFPRIYFGQQDALAEAITSKKSLSFTEYPFRCLHGSVHADISITPVQNQHYEVDSVEVIVHPRSTCTMAKKLLQSQKLIDIGKIASTLAHGVRNPLNAIKGAVVYLREKYEHEEPLGEFMKIMNEEIARLEEFISKFLSSSVSIIEDQETNINAVLKKIEVFTSLQVYARNIHSVYEYGAVPSMIINSFYLEQAVLNVINNAIDAIDTGGKLTIKTSAEEHNGKWYVVIAVSDTGPGFDKKTVDELMSGHQGKGRGFGLFITSEIIKHYGGHMEIDSKINSGTTVRLFIPDGSTGKIQGAAS